jgi:phosphohistidine phosphatase
MKHLYLVRHAKSSWKHKGLADFERPLNKRGRHDAPLMGRLLRERRINPDLIVSSPATRALATATLIAKEIHYEEERIEHEKRLYHASSAEMIDIIQQTPNNVQHLMVAGHNPGITALAYDLSGLTIDNIPTTGIYYVTFHVDQWDKVRPGIAHLGWFEYPKKYYK